MKDILSNRLETLIELKKDEDYKNSIPRQAEEMKIPYPSLVKYIKGTAECPAKNIIKIAKYYNVSTDYLLGYTDVKSTDTTVQEICKSTGLSESTIEKLILWQKSNDCRTSWGKHLSAIIESDNSDKLFNQITEFLFFSKIESKAVDKNNLSLALESIDMQMARLWIISKIFTDILEETATHIRIERR